MDSESTKIDQANDPDVNPLEQARLDIEDDISVYARAILDLKSRLNILTQIGRLPPELLSEIFVCTAKADFYDSNGSYYTRLSWIRLAHVCRHFRAVALHTPRFWSYLRLTNSKTFAELVACSKSAPLHISAHIDHSSRSDRIKALDMLFKYHSNRVKELRINGATKIVQSCCAKAVYSFATLERLELSTPAGHSAIIYIYDFEIPLPAVVPIFASSAAPPQLRHLELRRLPFRWDDVIFSSPKLTTLLVSGKSANNTYGDAFPDVGSFEELFSVLEALAPRLQVLEIEDALPSQALTDDNTLQLPLPSRTISLPSLKDIHLAGDALSLAHVLNHLSLPSTAQLRLTVRHQLGSETLMQVVAAHLSEKPPLLSLRIAGRDGFALTGWTHAGMSGNAALRMSFGHTSSRDFLGAILHASETLLARVQALELLGLFTWIRWAEVFSRFLSVETLTVSEHPFGDFFPALMAVRERGVPGDDRLDVPLPSLRVLDLWGFRFSLPRDELEPFDDLLDWAIFRCNHGYPIDELRLSVCKYACYERIEKLQEVVVDVRWDTWELETTSEEEREGYSEEEVDYSEDEYYGHAHHYGFGGW